MSSPAARARPAPTRRSAPKLPNAIPELLDAHPGIRAVAFNGGGARRLYDRHFTRRPDLTYLALPSTSPAYARIGFAAKLAQWQALREMLPGRESATARPQAEIYKR